MNEKVIDKNIESNPGLGFAMIIFILMGFASSISEEVLTITMISVSLFSILYIVYYLIYTEQHVEMLGGIVISLILIFIAALIPIVGPIILFLWILYNVIQSVDAIKQLIPDALFSMAIYISLWIPHVHEYRDYSIPAYIFYGMTSLVFIKKISSLALDSRASFFKFSIMLVSLPLIGLLIASIVTALRSMFRINTQIRTNVIKTPQQVSGYIRGDTVVSGYSRMVEKTVTQTVSKILPGTGAIAAVTGKNMATASLNQDQKSVPFVSTEPQLAEQMPALIDRRFVTSKEHSFYADDQIDQKKLNRFITKFNRKSSQKSIKKDDVLFYYDDTLMGSGDVGALITTKHLVCQPNFFEQAFIVELSDISKIKISGMMNKTISITTKNGNTNKIELTQSNKGATLFYEALQYVVRT